VWHSRASDSQSHTSHLNAGAPSAPLRAGRDGINPTFTWVRLAQRIPVRVQITHVSPGVLVSAGMTCTVVIKKARGLRSGSGSRKPWRHFFEHLRVRAVSINQLSRARSKTPPKSEKEARAISRFEPFDRTVRRWQRRYKRLGMGIVRRPADAERGVSNRNDQSLDVDSPDHLHPPARPGLILQRIPISLKVLSSQCHVSCFDCPSATGLGG
jgi:hypothetical protein